MGSVDIQITGMIFAFVPLLLSFGLLSVLGLRRHATLAISFGRMTVQLWLVGLYLSYIFAWNHWAVTFGYVLLMLAVANVSLLQGSGLRFVMFRYTFPALLLGMGLTLTYFTLLVFRPEPLHDARYVIPLAGMLLGNSMNRTIITLERFYSAIRSEHEGYASVVTMGATVREATAPYLRTAFRAGFEPFVANVASVGLVFLPGMMTGQILAGSPPDVAIKYQIVVMLAILVATELSTVLSVVFSLRRSFDDYGFLRTDIFK